MVKEIVAEEFESEVLGRCAGGICEDRGGRGT